jgi:hypothetical protein
LILPTPRARVDPCDARMRQDVFDCDDFGMVYGVKSGLKFFIKYAFGVQCYFKYDSES